MKKAVETASESQPMKARAVGGGMDSHLRDLCISTAKTVVGLDGISRRYQGVLTSVALLPGGHPYLEALKEAARAFNTDKKNLRGNGPEIAKLMPAHERA